MGLSYTFIILISSTSNQKIYTFIIFVIPPKISIYFLYIITILLTM